MENDIITKKELMILNFIKAYMNEHKWAPSVREIAAAAGIKSTSTVQDILLDLNKAKKIVYKGVRQIRIVE